MDRRQALAGLAALLASCGRGGGARIGSKNFTEQAILGEIAAQWLETKLEQRVDRKLDLGGTMVAHQAITSGSIDVYPEYTGTALTAVLKLPPSGDSNAIFRRVHEEYGKRFGLEWLPPLGFDNSFAMVIRSEVAKREGIATLSDAAKYQPGWSLGVGYEFLDRPDGLAALRKTYGLPIAGTPKTMDLGLLYRALEQGQVAMVAGNATDGLLSVLDLVVLRDDLRAFPPYQAALVLRSAAEGAARLREALSALSGKFTEKIMQALNHSVDGEHQRVSDVAAQFSREFMRG